MKNTKLDPSLFDQIRMLNISGSIQIIKDANIDWPVAAIFLGSGFLSAFLFKRYYKMCVISLAVGCILVWGLDHFFHVINWDSINTLLGNSPAAQVNSWIDSLSTWISLHIAFSLSFIIGMVIGVFS